MRTWISALIIAGCLCWASPAYSQGTPGDVAALEQQVAALTEQVEQATEQKTLLESLVGVWNACTNLSPAGAAIAGSLLTVLIGYYWEKRPKILKKVDNLQDRVQEHFTEKFGESAGKEVRELMEQIEQRVSSKIDKLHVDGMQVEDDALGHLRSISNNREIVARST